MRKMSELMEELGFREDAPEGAQKAFVKNLIRAAYGAEVKDLDSFRRQRLKEVEAANRALKKKVAGEPEQMSFDLGKLDVRKRR